MSVSDQKKLHAFIPVLLPESLAIRKQTVPLVMRHASLLPFALLSLFLCVWNVDIKPHRQKLLTKVQNNMSHFQKIDTATTHTFITCLYVNHVLSIFVLHATY